MKAQTSPTEIVTPGEGLLHTGSFTVEPARAFRAEEYPWEHEVRIALPHNYDRSEKAYPVLWMMDNALEPALVALDWLDLDLIIVSVGAQREAGGSGSPRRAYDFYPQADIYPKGPSRSVIQDRVAEEGFTPEGGGAAKFLDFLIDDLRPALSREYRMDENDHALEGFSAGGWFVMYALFSRPAAFAKYLAIAPSLYFCEDLIWEIEDRFAATHDDLRGGLFLGTGEDEMTSDNLFGCLSSMAKMVERLTFRNYKSLDIKAKIFPGESHETCVPIVLSHGVRSLWGDSIVR